MSHFNDPYQLFLVERKIISSGLYHRTEEAGKRIHFYPRKFDAPSIFLHKFDSPPTIHLYQYGGFDTYGCENPPKIDAHIALEEFEGHAKEIFAGDYSSVTVRSGTVRPVKRPDIWERLGRRLAR